MNNSQQQLELFYRIYNKNQNAWVYDVMEFVDYLERLYWYEIKKYMNSLSFEKVNNKKVYFLDFFDRVGQGKIRNEAWKYNIELLEV